MSKRTYSKCINSIIYTRGSIYHKLQYVSQLCKPKLISRNLAVDLYNKAKIQTFTTGWSL